jgi:hypothetical protein
MRKWLAKQLRAVAYWLDPINVIPFSITARIDSKEFDEEIERVLSVLRKLGGEGNE